MLTDLRYNINIFSSSGERCNCRDTVIFKYSNISLFGGGGWEWGKGFWC